MAPQRKKQRLSTDGGAEDAVLVKDSDDLKETSHGDSLPHKSQPSKKSLFVRSLPETATNDSLTELFSQSYPLKHATVVVDPATKKCKGYGFVSFADAEDAQHAREEFDGSMFEGRKIRVEIAEPRNRDKTANGGKEAEPSAVAKAKVEREKQQAEARQPPKLIVRNLPWSIKTPEQLSVLFRSYGKVKHATLPAKKPGLLAGFGFIVMRGRKNAEKALEGVNGKEIDGRTIAVDWAVEKEVWQSTQSKEDSTGQDVDAIKTEDELDGAASSDVDRLDQEDSDLAMSDADSDMDDEDFEDDYDDEDDEEEGPAPAKTNDNSSTLFIRNLPFTVTDESLKDHFTQFGAVRYARIVMDYETERPRGTGFVCFFEESDALSCLRNAPKNQRPVPHAGGGGHKGDKASLLVKHSVLENESVDPSGRYTMEGRVLHITRAVDRNEAARLTEEGVTNRERRDTDKRHLYLLSEGTVPTNSPLYQMLSPSEIKMREASAQQRKTFIQKNPTLHLSLTRLSIRNIPRNITSKELKALAREAVVGFASQVKQGIRKQLSKEEQERGGEEMKEAERLRKEKGKGIVKQAKIVFEGGDGSKVSEGTGAGRSRGYGFIEYTSHRWALMGLRWLNGHAISYQAREGGKPASKEEMQERKKRLIVEFAIENAQVMARRKENEQKARERSKAVAEKREKGELPAGKKALGKDTVMARQRKGMKRKRGDDEGNGKGAVKGKSKPADGATVERTAEQEKNSKRQKIIQKKRMVRRARKKGGKA
ncbi:MAG: hypothetical protein M1819_000012 [Sarea resinae]|nr:MAG: hypothetical protein M1819_000012 [Sarea resinae]